MTLDVRTTKIEYGKFFWIFECYQKIIFYGTVIIYIEMFTNVISTF